MKLKQTFLALSAAAAITLSAVGFAGAAGQSDLLKLTIVGQKSDTQLAVMVLVRDLAEELGFTVTWDGEDQMVTLDSGTMHANFTIGVNSYIAATSIEGMVGMTAPFTLSSAPVVSDGVTYVPLELFTVLMGNHADGLTVTDGTVDLRTEF